MYIFILEHARLNLSGMSKNGILLTMYWHDEPDWEWTVRKYPKSNDFNGNEVFFYLNIVYRMCIRKTEINAENSVKKGKNSIIAFFFMHLVSLWQTSRIAYKTRFFFPKNSLRCDNYSVTWTLWKYFKNGSTGSIIRTDTEGPCRLVVEVLKKSDLF